MAGTGEFGSLKEIDEWVEVTGEMERDRRRSGREKQELSGGRGRRERMKDFVSFALEEDPPSQSRLFLTSILFPRRFKKLLFLSSNHSFFLVLFLSRCLSFFLFFLLHFSAFVTW